MAKMTMAEFARAFPQEEGFSQETQFGMAGSKGKDMSQPQQFGLMSMEGAPGAGVPSQYRDMSSMGLMQRAPSRPMAEPPMDLPGPKPMGGIAGLMNMASSQQGGAPGQPLGMPGMDKYLAGLMGMGG